MRPVFSLWRGGPLTPLATAATRSFVELGHPYTLYAYDAVGPLLDGAELAGAGELLRGRNVTFLASRRAYSMISNLFRYTRVLEHGGLWVDADVIALRPFDFAADETVWLGRTAS